MSKKKQKTEPKTKGIYISVLPEQKPIIRDEAEALGYNVSEYLRRAWYLARKRPDLLYLTDEDEKAFRDAAGPSRWDKKGLDI